jgi:hypothetical protein
VSSPRPTAARPSGPLAAAWDTAPTQTRLERAKITVARRVLPVLGAAAVLADTIEVSMLTDDKSIGVKDREQARRLVAALRMVEAEAAVLQKRWGL